MSERDRPVVLRILPVLDFGGVETRVQIQSELIDRSRFDFRVLTFWTEGAAARRIRDLGIPVDALNENPAVRRPQATLALVRHLRRVRPDIVHSSIAEANFHSLIAAPAARVPVVIAEEVGIRTMHGFPKKVYSALYRTANLLLGVSQSTCDSMVHGQGAPARKVRLIHTCARPEFFPDVPRAPARASGAKFRILAVGRLVPVKNQLGLIDAFARIAEDHPQAELVIVGEGPLRPELEREVARRGLQDRILLPGFRADVRSVLEDADLFVLPSFSEGLPVSLIEALATGLPCLASRLQGVDEVFGELAARCTIAAEDSAGWARAMSTIIDMPPSERAELALTGQRMAYERFSPRQYVSRLEETYTELLPRVRR